MLYNPGFNDEAWAHFLNFGSRRAVFTRIDSARLIDRFATAIRFWSYSKKGYPFPRLLTIVIDDASAHSETPTLLSVVQTVDEHWREIEEMMNIFMGKEDYHADE